MAGYLFLYRSCSKNAAEMSPEDMQSYMQKWFEWIDQGTAAGWMTNPGDALKPDGCVIQADKSVTDGPFAEAKEIVGGYSLIEAESLEAAIQLANGCPVFIEGGTVEVRELAMVTAET